MTSAVGSATAAPYVTSPSNVSAAPSSSETPTAATPADIAQSLSAGSPLLADGTVATLVAQQADDGAPASSASNSATSTDHVQIPQAVLDNMKAFETTGPTAYTDQINQYVTTINDAKASDTDRFNAWTTLSGMLTSGTIYQAGNVADLQNAIDATQISGYSKDLMQLESRFHSTNVVDCANAEAQGKAGVQGTVDAFKAFSEADQQKIFSLMGFNQQYGDLATLKADYQNVADIYAKTGQLTMATMQLGSSAKPTAATASSNSMPQGQWNYEALNQAVTAVNDTSGKTSLSDQMAAYQMLQNYAVTGQDVGDTRKAIVNGWLNSPVTAQVQAALNKFSSAAWVGHGTSYSDYLDKRASAYNGLSSSEQTMLYAAQGSASYGSQADFAASFESDPGAAQALKTLQSIRDKMATTWDSSGNESLVLLFDRKPADGKKAAHQTSAVV